MLIINAMDPFASQGPCMLSKTITHWCALSLADEREPKTIAHCDAMRTDPAKFLWSTGVDSQARRSTKTLACWSRTLSLCPSAHSDIAPDTMPILLSFVTLSLFACHVRFFIYLHSATAAHKRLMRLIRRLVESPVLGTACLEHPAAHSMKILLPERRMDICIIRLDCSCEA